MFDFQQIFEKLEKGNEPESLSPASYCAEHEESHVSILVWLVLLFSIGQ